MENLLNIVRTYSDKSITEYALRKQISPINLNSTGVKPDEYKLFKKAILKAMYFFIIKDISKFDSYDRDQMRGLFYNRMRSEISNLQLGMFLGKHTRRSICQCMIMQYTNDLLDVERISLLAGYHTNKEITENKNNNPNGVSTEEFYLATVFSEMKVAGGMRNYLKDNGLEVTSSSVIEKNDYSNVLLNYNSKNFHSKS